ncbi:hypothetical protein [Nocardioides iriomotensis]|uniref:Uncharacterized protein n=1 Tax=Nocardioides iriomotensis TaxID=715784 RepID=A0A4Q5J1P3_9ACTN|nr:hypothetical protein [Nocardioides iriomotensis]RYU12233.1 hypothetical protein ETU37_09400 [Nocardioides iriomotensis]
MTQPSSGHKAGAFDIRIFISMLIGLYGVVLVATGLVGTSDDELARADGVNINLWAGLGMIVFAACFLAWARLRPVVVPDDEQRSEGDETP